MFHNGTRVLAGRRTTHAPSGSFTVRVLTANTAATDRVVARATSIEGDRPAWAEPRYDAWRGAGIPPLPSMSAPQPTMMDRYGSGVLRPRQDDHQPVVLARALAAAVPGGHGLARPVAARRVRATGVPAGRRGRAEDGPPEGRHAAAHEGMGPRPGRTSRPGRDPRRDRSVRVSGGAGPHRAAPERGSSHLHRVVLAGGGRASARPALRGRGRDRHARPSGRRREVHGRARVLRVR